MLLDQVFQFNGKAWECSEGVKFDIVNLLDTDLYTLLLYLEVLLENSYNIITKT